jgi:hypothetical protein
VSAKRVETVFLSGVDVGVVVSTRIAMAVVPDEGEAYEVIHAT